MIRRELAVDSWPREVPGWAENNCMQDFQLYQQILDLTEPWRVEEVTLKIKD